MIGQKWTGAVPFAAEALSRLCASGEAVQPGGGASGAWQGTGVSRSPRLEENTRSRDGSFSMHSTRDIGRQLKRI